MTLRTAFIVFASLVVPSVAQQGVLPENFRRIELTIEDTARHAFVYAPGSAKTSPAPVVFVFHGHGGTAPAVARSFGIHRHWPEAIAVYPQGLNTPGRLTDPEGRRPGWQHSAGAQGDRDLKFFDALLARLQADFRVDPRRVYCTGHSNGGAFTYLLWAERGDVFAAMAPSGSAAAQSAPKLKAKPAMHIAGENDPLVKYEWQKFTMQTVRKVNGCEAEGTAWGEHSTLYASKSGTPVVTFIHPGGHEFPKAAPPLIVKFFKEHARQD
jgi:polyhydroxybutyrate depolymerase